jgi:hypothetical protein
MTEDIARSESLLREWQGLMRTGVDAGRRGEPMVARRLYLQAQALTQSLLARPPCDAVADDDRMAAFVATHLKLADSFQATGHVSLALAQLWTAHQTLMALVRDESACISLRQAALRHSRETRTALFEYSAQHGSRPEIADALRDGCASTLLPPGAFVH